jgi:hypothetical protein
MAQSFHAQLQEVLDEYADEVGRAAAADVEEAGRSCAAAVRKNARAGFGGKGTYAAGWRCTFEDGVDGPTATVHNAGKQASLSHLLELGHEQFYMGRDLGHRYPGVPHIAPAYVEAAAELERKVAR